MRIRLTAGLLLLVAMLIGVAVSLSAAEQNKGPVVIELDGGTKGKIAFPHRRHQDRLDNCQKCHAVFPQQSGAIKQLKASGKLKKKYVMRKLCIKCHKTEKKAGRKAGPTSCAKCHVKAKS